MSWVTNVQKVILRSGVVRLVLVKALWFHFSLSIIERFVEHVVCHPKIALIIL